MQRETRKKFDLATISSLCTILNQKEEIIRLYETNEATAKRVRLTGSRLPSLDDKLYETFVNLRSQRVEVGGYDLVEKASEIKEKILANNNLTGIEKARLEKFKAILL